ncbi:MAG: hypothetical protein ABEH78_03770 [Haloferacaceae archaeon]
MPHVSTPGTVHSDDCPLIVPDLDAARYVSDHPDGRSLADCERCRT